MTNPVKPLRVSWSQLRNHEECKMKGHLLRTGKRAKAQNLRNFFHGTVVDRCMRDWLADPHRSPGGMADQITAMVERAQAEAKDEGGIVRWRSPTDRAELHAFCTELVRRLEPILRERVLPYPHTVSTRFDVPIIIPDPAGTPTQIRLIGETDLTVNNQGVQVWDLKGTADDQYYRKVLGQLYFYDLAVLAARGEPTTLTGLIQPMCSTPVLEVTVGVHERGQILSRIVRLCHDIWTGDTTCKPDTAGCVVCEVRHACPRYSLGLPGEPPGSLAEALRAHPGPGHG
jgi:hypothetical protein